MKSEFVVEIENVSLSYRSDNARKTLKNVIIKRQETYSSETFHLQSLNLKIKHGEQIGIIGKNGSGKSTLLKLIGGVLRPDIGKIIVDGEITPLLDIGTGMLFDLSCRDNIFLSGAYLGISRKDLRNSYDEIVKWAEIDEHQDSLFHTLSTGMQSRLAFSVATSQSPDIVLVDEILSVGDRTFQKKSQARMNELKSAGSAILIVSHDLEYLRNFVSRLIWIENGKIIRDGDTELVMNEYLLSFKN